MQLIKGETVIHGAKGGGGKQHTPVEEADDLLSDAKLKMLVVLSEGEIQGDLTAQEIYLNDTPLASSNGQYNFTGVVWDYRKGTQDQEYIQGMAEGTVSEFSVGVEVRNDQAYTSPEITDLTLDAIRVKLSLPVQYEYKNNGDMVGTVTEYAIDLYTDGALTSTITGKFDGKTTSEYQRDHRLTLPPATQQWNFVVRRLTPDSTEAKKVNAFKVFSYATVVDSKLRYPNTALLYIEVDAKQFNGSAPKITCKPKGKLVKIPDNYDPVSREYHGDWKGAFKLGYTNNPAWIFYDLITDPIYGMGERISADDVDKWQLYAIAQYCDGEVMNGKGGTEPRFTCNTFIQSQRDAYTVLSDIAAIFRGITFWGNDSISVTADAPHEDVDFVYHASNVIDGMFTYAGGSYKNRYSSCLVAWSDPQNHYTDTTECVYEPDLVERYGVNQTQLTAIGCTSQSEAQRRGRWVLLSNAKDATISFNVGLDGYIPLPAEIIGVADPFRAGKQNGGRLSAVNGLNLTLDRPIDYAAKDRIILNLPSGKGQTRTITAISDDKRTVTVSSAFDETPAVGAVWAIDSDNLAIQYYRVTSIKAIDDGNGGFTISGVIHDLNKYDLIDKGVRLPTIPITVTPVNVLEAPKNIQIGETDCVIQGLSVSTMTATWDKVDHAVSYVAQWRKDNGDWINVPNTSAQGFSVQGIYTGAYDVRVRALNAVGTSSPWGNAERTTLNGKTGKPGTPIGLTASKDIVWNVNLSWAFPEGSGDTAYTEIERSSVPNPHDDATQLTMVPYPQSNYQHGPMPAGVLQWYRVRLVDKIGNVSDWTDWAQGASSSDASDMLGDITDSFMTSEAGQKLQEEIEAINIDPEAILQNALANYETVNQQWAQYGENKAGIVESQNLIANESEARAELEQDLIAKVGDNTSLIQNVQQAVATTNETLTNVQETMDSKFAASDAAITEVRQTATDANTAVSNLDTKVQAQIGDVMTQISQAAESYVDTNGASGIYTMKIGVKSGDIKADAGISVSATINGTAISTAVAIQASRFIILTADGSAAGAASPFAVVNGQVFMNSAFIQDASITNAKIGDSIESSTFATGMGWQLSKSQNRLTFKDGNGVVRFICGQIG